MAADLLGGNQVLRVRVGNVADELGVADHIRQLRAGSGVTEEGFREEEDELCTRFSKSFVVNEL